MRGKIRRLSLSSRQLNTASLVAEYEILIEAYCDTDACSDAEAIGNALYVQVSDILRDAIKDGTLIHFALHSTSTGKMYRFSAKKFPKIPMEEQSSLASLDSACLSTVEERADSVLRSTGSIASSAACAPRTDATGTTAA